MIYDEPTRLEGINNTKACFYIFYVTTSMFQIVDCLFISSLALYMEDNGRG